MNVYVLDTCAVIAYLNQEEGADEVDNILPQAECTRSISIINVYEVCYDAARLAGFDEGVKLYQELHNFPITIVRELEEEVIKQAIHFKINYRVSVADSIALGLAKSKKAILVTADHHEFDPIDQANELKFHWVR